MSDSRQHAADIRLMRELVEASEYESELPEAVLEIAERVETGRQYVLTPKQREWMNDLARKFDIEPALGPEDEGGPEPVRFSVGAIPRGKEVAPLFAKGPLKPPGRT